MLNDRRNAKNKPGRLFVLQPAASSVVQQLRDVFEEADWKLSELMTLHASLREALKPITVDRRAEIQARQLREMQEGMAAIVERQKRELAELEEFSNEDDSISAALAALRVRVQASARRFVESER